MKQSCVFWKIYFIICILLHFQSCSVRVKRIIGGELYEKTNQDFLVALIGEKGYSWDILRLWGDYHKSHCTGAVISDQWIITAAHCFFAVREIDDEVNGKDNESSTVSEEEETDYDYYEEMVTETVGRTHLIKKKSSGSAVKEIIDLSDPIYWKARIGVRRLEPTHQEIIVNFLQRFLNKNPKTLYHEISKIIRHPLYDPLYLENDIAVLKLKTKLNTSRNSNIGIISLTSQTDSNYSWPISGQICKAIGWGCKEFKGPITNEPYFANFPILKPSFCRKFYNGNINLTDQQEFCAGNFNKNKGICAGDSGGPLLCEENGISVLAGIAEATHSDFPKDYPGIYTRITYFKSWINEIIKHN